ncbi:MAG: oligopeptidase A [Gammaproteobacteria bacterium]|nr:oligopeptidase A [Gammaproteobacteria bacterium]
MENPLLVENQELPLFSLIKPEHVEPAIDTILADNRAGLSELLNQNSHYSWANLIEPLDTMHDRLSKAWSPVQHMNAVVNSDELREAYNACLPKLSAYWTELGQNKQLYLAYQNIADSSEYSVLDHAQQQVIKNALRDFKLSGVALTDQKQQRYREIAEQLSKLTSQFEENVMDSTNAWSKHVTDAAILEGMPETALAVAEQTAQQRDLPGWVLTLDFPCYLAVMMYADNRDLRQELYEAFCTRASGQGPHDSQYDNTGIMAEILELRHEQAQLLDFENYAELSLQTKMAEDPDQVQSFLEDLAKRSVPIARKEFEELKGFAQQQLGLDDLNPWDAVFASEKMRSHLYSISQQDIKVYFPVQRVIEGLFKVVERLYGLSITQLNGIDTWHSDVQFFEIRDGNHQLRGKFYLDLYARPKKRGGAWMDDCADRRKTEKRVQTPIAFLTCNFTPPASGQPTLLTHDEVNTLFHEFGHGLHHMLTRIDYPGVSGINGVEWDAVELPSQFMENWCWEPEALALFSGHYETGAPLPAEMLEKMLKAKNYQSGMQMVRQLEFAIFDMRIHKEYDPQQGDRIYDILNQVRDQVSVLKAPGYNRFAHSFGHIFAGGYAAGYYSYKWAEVLSSDAFSLFEENGIFDKKTGKHFLTSVLEKGGSQQALDLFVAFRGRQPEIHALLRHTGIVDQTEAV